MDIFSLVAKIGLDSASFITGIGAAQSLFNTFTNTVVSFSEDVMSTGMNFDSAMSSVQAVLGEQEGTVERMNQLRAFALDQAKDSVYTAEQTANAYYYMGMAGWKSEQMMAGLPGIMALAAASGEDLATVSDIVTDSLTAFGLGAEDAGRYTDILAQTATNANTTVGLMGETFKYVAPIAGSLGADVDDVAVSIGLMANAGIKGSMAGTALRQIFTRISTDAGASENKLGALGIITDELGVKFRDNAGKMRDWGDVIADIRVKWKDLSDEQQVAYAKQIASERGMAGWLALMNASEADVQKLTAAIDEAGGAAQRMADVKLDNLSGDVTRLNSAFDILKVAIYDDVKGPMREVVQWATAAINDVTNAINENGLAGGIDVLGDKIEEAGEKFAPLLESIGKAAGPLVAAIFDSVLPKLTEAGAKLGKGLLTALGDSMTNEGGQASGLAGVFIYALGSGLEIISTISGWMKQAGTEGGKEMAMETANQLLGVTPEMQADIEAKVAAAAGENGGGKLATDTLNALLGVTPSMQSDIEAKLGAAGEAAGQSIASSIASSLAAQSFTINVKANVSGLPAQRNASAMTSGRIFSRATVFGVANGQYQVAGDAGPEAVIGTNSLAQLIQGAVNRAMGGQVFATPSASAVPRDIVIPIYFEGREFARVSLPFLEAERRRVGTKLVTGGGL